MQQTTHAGTHNPKAPPADTGPYSYDLPVVHGGVGQPAPVSQPAPKAGGRWWTSTLAIAFASIAAPILHDLSGWPRLHCYVLLYCLTTVLSYWDTPQPREGFLRWTLKVVGLFLNFFFALVSVPQSLLGLLPDSLAFALPAFAIFIIFYWVPPLIQNRKTPPLWQWLLWSAAFAAFWGWAGPSLTT